MLKWKLIAVLWFPVALASLNAHGAVPKNHPLELNRKLAATTEVFHFGDGPGEILSIGEFNVGDQIQIPRSPGMNVEIDRSLLTAPQDPAADETPECQFYSYEENLYKGTRLTITQIKPDLTSGKGGFRIYGQLSGINNGDTVGGESCNNGDIIAVTQNDLEKMQGPVSWTAQLKNLFQ